MTAFRSIRRSGRAAVRGIRFSELRNLPVLRNGIWLRRRNRGARGSAEGVGRQRNALVEWQRRPTEWLGSTGPVAQIDYSVAAGQRLLASEHRHRVEACRGDRGQQAGCERDGTERRGHDGERERVALADPVEQRGQESRKGGSPRAQLGRCARNRTDCFQWGTGFPGDRRPEEL